MKPIEQYRRFGLEKAITIKPGIRFHFLLWGGGSFLILGCIIAMAEGNILEQLIGAFGIVFLGLALGIMFFALIKSGSRGLLEISNQGIYMSHIGVVLPWEDLGPAWLSVIKHQGGRTKDVGFVLRNVSKHTAKMGSLGRMLMGFSKKVSHSESGGLVDWGFKALLFAADANDMNDQLAAELARIRNSVMNEPTSTVFNIPVPLRFGISAEDLVAIINYEVALRNGLLEG